MNFSLFPIIILLSISFISVYGAFADNVGRLALELEDSPGSGIFTEVWFQQGTQGNQWNQIIVDLSTEDNTGQRQIRFVATELVTGIRSDMAVDEIIIHGITIGTPAIISFEDYETEFHTWINTSGDDNDCWKRNSSITPTGKTGPSSGADRTTWYVFYESSNGCSPGAQQSFLLGPTIDFDAFNDVEITFWNHMWDSIHHASEPDLDFMVYKGNQYYKLAQYETALAIFEDILKKEKTNVQAFINLGHSYFSLEKYNKAIHRYERAIELGTNDNLVLHRLQLSLLETTSYELGFLDGILEIQIHDSKGNLVGYIQTSQIKALKHPMSEKLIDSWPVYGITEDNNQDYSIHQKKFVEIVDYNTILGFHEIPFSEKIDLPMASTWHYQIPVEKDDVVSYLYSIYRPII